MKVDYSNCMLHHNITDEVDNQFLKWIHKITSSHVKSLPKLSNRHRLICLILLYIQNATFHFSTKSRALLSYKLERQTNRNCSRLSSKICSNLLRCALDARLLALRLCGEPLADKEKFVFFRTFS